MISKKELITGLFAGIVLFIVALLRPANYAAEATFFVPLTLLEKQIAQNGIGFGSPTEVDAHIELMQSPRIARILEDQFLHDFTLDIRKTRNGAVAAEVTASEGELAAAIANRAVDVTDSVKQHMLRQNVGMSFEVMKERASTLRQEEVGLRKALDSLRFEAQTDSLALAARIYRKERQYGTLVVELTKAERKLAELREYTDAPAPKSYVISPAIPPKQPSGIPAWAIGLLGALLVGAAVKLWSSRPH